MSTPLPVTPSQAMMQRVHQMMQQQAAKKRYKGPSKSWVKKKTRGKEMVSLAQVVRKLPKELKSQQVSFTGRTTFQSLLKHLKAGRIKIDALPWR